ncbi:MAG: hypothetical protein WB495_27015 [Xanthobacteraceae bacterium]
MSQQREIETTETTNRILININKHLFLIETLLLIAIGLLVVIAYRI